MTATVTVDATCVVCQEAWPCTTSRMRGSCFLCDRPCTDCAAHCPSEAVRP